MRYTLAPSSTALIPICSIRSRSSRRVRTSQRPSLLCYIICHETSGVSEMIKFPTRTSFASADRNFMSMSQLCGGVLWPGAHVCIFRRLLTSGT